MDKKKKECDCESQTRRVALRDHFAAKALQAILSEEGAVDSWSETNALIQAQKAYAFADGMMKAREQ